MMSLPCRISSDGTDSLTGLVKESESPNLLTRFLVFYPVLQTNEFESDHVIETTSLCFISLLQLWMKGTLLF